MNELTFIHILQHCVSILSFLLGIYLVSLLIRDRKTPGSTWGWLLTMVLIPYVGVPLYLALGRRKLKKKVSQKEGLYPAVPYHKTPLDFLPLERILLTSGGPEKRNHNTVKLLSTGEDAFLEILSLMKQAEKSIWVTTFILGNDAVGSEILSVLTEQAKKGIEVCLLLDGLGSFWAPRSKLRALRRAGGKISFFLPLIHIPFFGHSNLRNHRKLIIIDEKVSVLGGMNLAKEYISPLPDSRLWVDLSFLIEGNGVRDLSSIFISDWNFASHDKLMLSGPGSGPGSEKEKKELGNSSIQVVGSGPDVSGDPLYDSIIFAIFNAQKRIWMATPYFIPDEMLAKALELACRRGVDVRLIIPKKSNHALADFCRGSYLRQVDQAGGQLYFDLHPMMHAKVILIDDSYVMAGSANIDMRSLLLNYEIGLFLYTAKDIQMISDWFLSLQEHSINEHLKKSFFADFLDGVGRILGPMI